MKTDSYQDGSGGTRYHFACTIGENFTYDSMMERQGMGRVMGITREGRRIEYWLPKTKLRQIGWKLYRWVDDNGQSQSERLPVYADPYDPQPLPISPPETRFADAEF